MSPSPRRALLIALDSVGIDPLGHGRPESVYAESTFLFPPAFDGAARALDRGPRRGALVATDVTGGRTSGAIECAVTYTSLFTGLDALERHGLMEGLGTRDAVLEAMLAEQNLFARFPRACLANALFPRHLPFLRGSYAEDLLPAVSREAVEARVTWRGEPVVLTGAEKRGLAELFTLAEINQNVFVRAAREAGVSLRTHDDVRAGRALSSSLTHELEAELDLTGIGIPGLPLRTPEEAASVLSALTREHDFTFYKYQLADLVSHTGRVELARAVFATIERFLGALLRELDTDAGEALVIVTSDHGHLEQVGFTQGHPKSMVPTWVFGPEAEPRAARAVTPQAIFELVAELAPA